MKIALVGTRGIPGRYGGFETFAEELSTRLVLRGHVVTVFGRTHFFSPWCIEDYQGVHRIQAWTLFQKHLETPLAALSSFLYLVSRRRDFDVVLLCNAANSIFAFLPRLFGIPVVINVDGIERKRAKWGILARWWYRAGEIFSVLFGNHIIADARSIAHYYAETYGSPSKFLAYGAHARKNTAAGVLEKFGLTPREYFLYVSRLEPENNALGVIRAFNKVNSPYPLVVVGDAPYASEYRRQLHEIAGENVFFTGYQFGDAYHELQANCYLYIQATEVGGTHPALIEAMAHGNCIVANGVPEHFEVLRGAGLYYPKNDFDCLGELLRHLIENRSLVEQHRILAEKEATRSYNWEMICSEYEQFLKSLLTC
ncbi:MAG: DUF1972 domain-containing protein [Bdellovibrionales bacterium]|nr:DUF1972 domain-containing protein [Bdellovibrionales bacterium]